VWSGTWGSPTSAYLDDGVYSTVTIAAKNTNYGGNYGGFNVASPIPVGSTINSVTAQAEFKVSTTASIANFGLVVQSPSGTNRGTETVNNSEPAADTVVTQVATGLTLADLANGTLFVRASARQGNNATSCTYSLDYVQVVVDYSLAPTVGPKQINYQSAVNRSYTW